MLASVHGQHDDVLAVWAEVPRVGKPILDYRLKPLIERFGDRPVAEIKTADIDDFVADLKRPRVVNGLEGRRLTPASINRTLGLLRHMLTQ